MTDLETVQALRPRRRVAGVLIALMVCAAVVALGWFAVLCLRAERDRDIGTACVKEGGNWSQDFGCRVPDVEVHVHKAEPQANPWRGGA